MSIGRWDPFDELVTLRESMEHLFEEMYSCRPPLFRDAPVMWETDAALVFRAELPSADPARIEVSLSEDTLTVTAEGLRRTIPLPVTVAPGQARATLRDGRLGGGRAQTGAWGGGGGGRRWGRGGGGGEAAAPAGARDAGPLERRPQGPPPPRRGPRHE